MTAVEIPANPHDPAWHEARRTFLGASDAAAVLGISPWRTALDVWAEKLGYVEPKPATLATDLGQELEEFIAGQWQLRTGLILIDRAPTTVRKPNSPLACTPDRYVDPDGLVECKLVGGTVAHQWENGPPVYVETQARLQMHILGAQWCDVASLHAGRGWDYRVHRYEHDPAIVDPIVEQLEAWWQRHVVEGERPELVGDPHKLKESLGYLYPPRDDSVSVRLPSDALETIAELKRTKALAADLKRDVARLEAELMAMLGDATDGYLDDNAAPVVTWRSQTRAAYTVEEKTFRVLRVK